MRRGYCRGGDGGWGSGVSLVVDGSGGSDSVNCGATGAVGDVGCAGLSSVLGWGCADVLSTGLGVAALCGVVGVGMRGSGTAG